MSKKWFLLNLLVLPLCLTLISSLSSGDDNVCTNEKEDQHVKPDLYISEGGWKTYVKDVVAKPGPCNIPIISGDQMTNKRFLKEFAYHQPFVLRDATDNTVFRALSSKPELLSNYGSALVRLSSANSYSYDKKDILFKDYANNMMGPQRLDTLANETFYFFGDNDIDEWKSLFDKYIQPPLSLPFHSPAFSYGLGGQGTGVPFHFHGPGFAETLYGRKRWFLTPPDVKPNFHPNKTTLQWFIQDYPNQKEEFDFLECTIRPGEIIYFPDKWWHATLNIDASVFISTFLSP